jgi:hypothetical protein
MKYTPGFVMVLLVIRNPTVRKGAIADGEDFGTLPHGRVSD